MLIRVHCSSPIQLLKDTNVVLTIGVFDGVHIGHRHLIRYTSQLAMNLSAACTVYTFWPYPRHNYDPEDKFMLCSPERKYEIFKELGVGHVVEQSFEPSFARLTAEEFIKHLIQQMPLLRGICVGEDFHFGYGRSDGTDRLYSLCTQYGIICQIVPRLALDGQVVSSTLIRKLLLANDEQGAAKLLGTELSTDDDYGKFTKDKKLA